MPQRAPLVGINHVALEATGIDAADDRTADLDKGADAQAHLADKGIEA